MATKEVIGIDFGSYEIKVVRFDLRERAVVAVHRIPRTKEGQKAADFEEEATSPHDTNNAEEGSDEPHWYNALRDILSELSNAKIYVNAPDTISASLSVGVPFSEREKALSVIPFLIADQIPMELKKVVYDFHTFDSTRFADSPAEAIVAFAKKHDIEEFLRVLKEVGIDPALVAVPAITLGIFASTLPTQNEGYMAYLDIGHESTSFVVLKEGEPILARSIRSGGDQITKLIEKRFGQTYSEAEKIKHKFAAIVSEQDQSVNDQTRLVSATIIEGLIPILRDIRRSLQGLYSAAGIEVANLSICGGTSQIKNIERYFTDELGIRTRRFVSDIPGDLSGDLSMAAGLIKSASSERILARNPSLRQGDLAYTGGGSAIKKRIIRFAMVAALMSLILFGIFILQKKGHEARREAMKGTLAKESKKLFGRKTMSVKKVREALLEGEDNSRAFVPKISAYELMHDITKKMSMDIELDLNRLQVDLPRKVIQISGDTTDAQAVDRIVSELREIECFKKVTPGATKLKNDKARFDISIQSGCS